MRVENPPTLETDEEADNWYNSGLIGMSGTRNSYEVLEVIDKLLAKRDLELVLWKTGSSDYVFSIQEKKK
jgi:hypothetical protein